MIALSPGCTVTSWLPDPSEQFPRLAWLISVRYVPVPSPGDVDVTVQGTFWAPTEPPAVGGVVGVVVVAVVVEPPPVVSAAAAGASTAAPSPAATAATVATSRVDVIPRGIPTPSAPSAG